ncbi:MAG: DUF928 domain-containing protein [Alkalinema sp. RU_4_3]|nr:DUF928 domain-containing protein [Alkalinema sp. RU_4_3]
MRFNQAELTIALFITLSAIGIKPSVAADPPSTGVPGRRADAGSRGCGDNDPVIKPLTALVPIQKTATSTTVIGKTAASHPTFWFYLPHRAPFTAKFVLQDEAGEALYESDVALPTDTNILSITLPKTVAPLATGKQYQWFFKLYCQSISPPESFVNGWIQREALPSDLTQHLKTANPQQQIQLYAKGGFWHESLATAAELQQQNLGDGAWGDLLRSIGLETIAKEATP